MGKNAKQIVDELLEARWTDPAPPKVAFDDTEAETEFYARNPFMAYSLAMDRGHHPKLWQVVKGSVYEPLYRKRFKMLEDRSPRMKTLKQHRVALTDKERKEVMRRKAVWNHGKNGEATPAVWKSVVDGKTFYVCNTHRAAQVKPTLKGAIRAYDFVKTTS